MGADQGNGVAGINIVEVKATALSIRLADTPRQQADLVSTGRYT